MKHDIYKKPVLIVVTGPTAIGKTTVSIDIARFFDAEIISSDSRQLYKEMQIGTAVPDVKELNEVYHHFIHSHSIFDYYNASMFEEDVLNVLDKLFSTGQIAVMTGGSMLYIDAVCNGIDDLPVVDMDVRNKIIDRFEKEGLESLRFDLKRLDPEYYKVVDLQNHKRIMHAIEICIMTGKPYSTFRTSTKKERPFTILKIGLNASRETIYNRINQRVDSMVQAGLEEEARRLLPYKANNALNTVGYREWFDYFEGLTSYNETIEKIKSNTRRYARKQLTWFIRDNEINWFDISETHRIIPFIQNQLNILWGTQEHL